MLAQSLLTAAIQSAALRELLAYLRPIQRSQSRQRSRPPSPRFRRRNRPTHLLPGWGCTTRPAVFIDAHGSLGRLSVRSRFAMTRERRYCSTVNNGATHEAGALECLGTHRLSASHSGSVHKATNLLARVRICSSVTLAPLRGAPRTAAEQVQPATAAASHQIAILSGYHRLLKSDMSLRSVCL
jgi:hypothetical protein